MFIPITAQEFFTRADPYHIIDVRSPGEFAKGHVPGAHNIPLFSDTERAVIGTAYKHQGKQEAMRLGMDIFGPQITRYIDLITEQANGKPLLVYCWRGGMRSKSVCMLLKFFGYQAVQLIEGYKAYRKHLYENAKNPYLIILLGGKTGCGKTKILKELQICGQQVIDLEKLAHHKGSVFGALGEQAQPSQEQFITNVLLQLIKMDPSKPIWIEKESSTIGKLNIPEQLWKQMEQSPVLYIDVPHKQRIANLLEDYGKFSTEQLDHCIKCLSKKLGGAQTNHVSALINEQKLTEAIELLLVYYDKLYSYGTETKQRDLIHIPLDTHTQNLQAKELLSFCKKNDVKGSLCMST